MELHTVTCCPLGVSSSRGCTFHPKTRNLLIPSSSQDMESKIHLTDLKIMIQPSKEYGSRFHDAFFKKKITAFVRDRDKEENHDRLLVVLISYDKVLITPENFNTVFSCTYFWVKNRRESHVYILSFAKDDNFDFDLINYKDERKSYSLRYDKIAKAVEVIDYSEEDLRRQPVPHDSAAAFYHFGQMMFRKIFGAGR